MLKPADEKVNYFNAIEFLGGTGHQRDGNVGAFPGDWGDGARGSVELTMSRAQ